MKKYIYLLANNNNRWQVIHKIISSVPQDILCDDIVTLCNIYKDYQITTYLSDNANIKEVEQEFNK